MCFNQSCPRVLLCVFNVAVIASGITISLMSMVTKPVNRILEMQAVPSLYVGLIVLFGLFVAILGGIGSFSTWQRVKTCLRVYAGILMVLGLVMIIISIYYLGYSVKKVDQWVLDRRGDFYKLIMVYNRSKKLSARINRLQFTFKCCGVDTSADWIGIYEYPMSCCNMKQGNCILHQVYRTGCLGIMLRYFKNLVKIVWGLLVDFGLLYCVTSFMAIFVSCM